tara:strand:- start:3344 stop:4996 length:1653 start_codon:yes stop_codon:yes gene_type:complete
MIIKKYFLFVFIITVFFCRGQQLYFPMYHDENAFVEMYLNKVNSKVHTSIKPFFYNDVIAEINIDSIDSAVTDTNRLYLLPSSYFAKFMRWSENKLMDEDLVYIDSDGLKLRANLLLGLQIGREGNQEENYWQNTRGYWLSGQVGEKAFFESAFYETQSKLLPFVNAYARQGFVLPGQGRFKPFKQNVGADWAFATGAFGYRANKYFTAYVGHGKNFIGDGYRSLLLSDNAFNYPYFKLETTVWNIKYTNIWAQLSHIGFFPGAAGDRNWTQKFIAVHHLSWNATKRLNIGLYESTSWLKEGRGFDWQYMNPVIFMRPVEWQNGSADNILLGANTKFKINDHYTLYGQFVLDDLNLAKLQETSGYWGNKYGGQLGVKACNIANVYGLSAQLEYNVARPFTYTHFDSANAHTHMNEPLAHPLGANFQEAVAMVRYKYKRHKLSAKMIWSEAGKDTLNVNHGGNIFLSYNTNKIDPNGNGEFTGNTIGQGDLNKLNLFDIRYAFLINPRARLYLELGYLDRILTSKTAERSETQFIFVGLRTTLNNFYYDYF